MKCVLSRSKFVDDVLTKLCGRTSLDLALYSVNESLLSVEGSLRNIKMIIAADAQEKYFPK